MTMGVFTRSGKNKLTLSRYGTRSMGYDPSDESMRLGHVGEAIGELASELKIKSGTPINYVVSGQSVFIRFIKLPPLENADVGQLVKFEAQQQVPFPIDEVIWDYHLLPSDGLEQEAVLVAIKADELNALDNIVEGHGFETAHVDCSASALYNAYRDSYPSETDPVMIIDIGAKTTDIIYCEGNRFFTRSVSLGGVFVTSAIAREYKTSFQEAEQVKVSKGLVSMTNGQTEGMPQDVAALATTIRNAMTRLASEIQRTTNHYKTQIHGNAPVKAYLCGGGASLAYTKEFLEERLGIPVAFFNPMHQIGVGPQVNVDKISAEAYMLGDIIGVALNVANRESISIDLVPTAVGRRRIAQKKLPKVVAAVAMAVIGAGVYTWAMFESADKAQSVLSKIEDQNSQISGLSQQIAKNKTAILQLDKQLEQYQKLTFQRYGYVSAIKEFVTTAASDSFWITDFLPWINYDPEQTASISGKTLIKDTFMTEKASSIVPPEAPQKNATGSRRGSAEAKEAKYEVNAIVLKGYARSAMGGSRIVQDIQGKLAENGDASLFSFKKPDGSDMEASQIIKEDPKKSNSFVKQFELVLPLKQPLPIKAQEENK